MTGAQNFHFLYHNKEFIFLALWDYLAYCESVEKANTLPLTPMLGGLGNGTKTLPTAHESAKQS